MRVNEWKFWFWLSAFATGWVLGTLVALWPPYW